MEALGLIALGIVIGLAVIFVPLGIWIMRAAIKLTKENKGNEPPRAHGGRTNASSLPMESDNAHYPSGIALYNSAGAGDS